MSAIAAQDRPVSLPSRPGGKSPGGLPGNLGGRISRGFSGGGQIDSLEHRDRYEDSITIYYQLPSLAQNFKLDSSVADFTKRFPIPAHHAFLGNNGTATHSLLFTPNMQSGWDHGFHAYDAYRWKQESVRFFNTTRPYTELAYLLGGRTEQIIEVTHTQNLRPNWNALFQYRLINAPGFFKNQKTNHNNYLFTSWYQSVNKRYNNYLVLLGNALQSEESGGIRNDYDYLNDERYNDRFSVPTQTGPDQEFSRNFFSSKLYTGNRYKDFSFTLTQQYDFGKKDSLVSDSTVIPLFYPRLRFEHTFRYSKYNFLFVDFFGDSVYYQNAYNLTLPDFNDTVEAQDKWKELVNDLSVYQFPDAKNLQQYIKAGITYQILKAQTFFIRESFNNILVHGEYINKTRNRKWDIAAAGKYYIKGLNSGDYQAALSLKRFAGKRNAYLELGFRNVNRTPSFIFDSRSSFYFDLIKDFKKENITQITAAFFEPRFGVKLTGNYYLISNYTYFSYFYSAQQREALFNLIQISAEKKFRIGKRWMLYSDIHFQKKTGDAELNVPLIFTRNRFGYEGSLGFKNLSIFMGLELKYHTPFEADGYSPLLGQFFYQSVVKITNRPDVAAFVHFRIRNFRAFIRAENLNSVTTTNGFGFRYHNFAAPSYPYPGLNIRLGVYWSFVN